MHGKLLYHIVIILRVLMFEMYVIMALCYWCSVGPYPTIGV